MPYRLCFENKYEGFGRRGLRTSRICENVVDDIDNRCTYCYETRLRKTAEFAAEHGFKQFTTTLLASVYQKHELIAAAGERFGKEFGVEFLYRDFRPNFRAGNQRARELGFYMQNTADVSFLRRTDTKKQSSAKKKGFLKNLILLHYKDKTAYRELDPDKPFFYT